ncbi:shikimate dehydrogenase [Paenibacillus chitinolyticus]|uniref:Shikimate dehydrogenase (NADP(+)) n=1 Tax=Paenibacillus chitinolyticus TaxID=79263 RepID=A0A410X1J6_9BACL|nr:shikimate dehydrogenase [Paenibacillus chitinolyticus]MCY9592565.1 shikimate dehydrogenase [Paenibacillus chitinolyticus]MCY9594832.1 shikimate dehydrogenase [Paenibacillus chitinolyticus]QAV20483.1 shikimate dehydrogenase [Paenibacillus chitinolyticus]
MGNKPSLDSGTILYGVFGDPVRHSRSPIMMNRAFGETGINGAYAAFHVLPEQLEEAVAGIRALGFGGVNVTIPHKVNVMKYLDEINADAEALGAVNTVVNRGGKLIGYNTDGIGYVRSLKEETGMDLRGKKVLLIGAGGAARGISYALAKEGPSFIAIANRTAEKAQELASTVRSETSAVGMGLHELGNIISDADLIINSTSSGMYPNIEEMPLDLDGHSLREGAVVSDLVYNPLETRFLKEAKAKGAVTHGGLGMFIYQGAYAFEYWTGVPAPAAAMRQAVEQSFIGN